MPRVFVYATTSGGTAETTALSLVSMRDRSRPSIVNDQVGLNLLAEAAGDPELEPESQPQVDALKPLTKGEDASAIVHCSPYLTENESVEAVGGSKVEIDEDSTETEESDDSSTQDCSRLRRDGDNGRSSLSSHEDGETRTEPEAKAFKPSVQQNDLPSAASSTTCQVGETSKGTTIGVLPERSESRETNEPIESSEQGILGLGPGRKGKGDVRLCDQGALNQKTHFEVSNPEGKGNVDPSEDVPITSPTKRAKWDENAATRDEIGRGNLGNTCDKHEDKGDSSQPHRVNGDPSTARADRKSGSESHDGHSLTSSERDSTQDGEESMATKASSPVVGGLKASTLGCDSGASVGSPAASPSKFNPAVESNAPQSVRSACDEVIAEVTPDRIERKQAHELRVPPMVEDVTRGGHDGAEAGDDESLEGAQSDDTQMSNTELPGLGGHDGAEAGDDESLEGAQSDRTQMSDTESPDFSGKESKANHVSASLSSTSGDACVSSVSVKPAPKGRSVSGRDWKVRKQSQRASMQVTTATDTLSSTWARKLEIKAKRKASIAMEQEMKQRKRREIEDKKEERLERERRRQRNEMKNTTYQTISKTHKLKTMSKKQLRQIKKRQVNARTGEVEFVSPWGGSNKK